MSNFYTSARLAIETLAFTAFMAALGFVVIIAGAATGAL